MRIRAREERAPREHLLEPRMWRWRPFGQRDSHMHRDDPLVPADFPIRVRRESNTVAEGSEERHARASFGDGGTDDAIALADEIEENGRCDRHDVVPGGRSSA